MRYILDDDAVMLEVVNRCLGRAKRVFQVVEADLHDETPRIVFGLGNCPRP